MAAPVARQMGYMAPSHVDAMSAALTAAPTALAAVSAALTAASLSTNGTTGGILSAGLRCRYHSARYGWVPCQIVRANPFDGTYDLDVRQQASANKLAPIAESDSTGTHVWPAGSLVFYHSQSCDAWLPTEIRSHNHSNGTYNLGMREQAHPDRIRARPAASAAQGCPNANLPVSSGVPPQALGAPYTPSTAQQQQLNQSYQNAFTVEHLWNCVQMGQSMVNTSLPPQLPPPTLPPNTQHPVVEDASIQPIVHPGHAPRQDEQLVGVIVTIRSGNSYDPLFTQVPQLAGEGQRVATYSASSSSLRHILGELSGHPVQGRRSTALHRNLRHIVADIQAVQPDSVVFNWECCSGCSSEHFEDCTDIMDGVKQLLDRGHMVMFSDFSLKALIKNWREDLLGPNPFVKTSEFGGSFKLRFDPAVLGSCPSAQLQKLGELSSDGKAELHALPSTIAFSVRWSKADCSAYDCKVLTVMTELNGEPARPVPGEGCDVGGHHRGFAGHALLTYPSGGRLLASAGHWVELCRLDVTEANLLQAAASYGAAFQNEVQASMASCTTAEQKSKTLQTYGSQMVQQASPCSYSLPIRQPQSAPPRLAPAPLLGFLSP